jgi:hypothetical protein
MSSASGGGGYAVTSGATAYGGAGGCCGNGGAGGRGGDATAVSSGNSTGDSVVTSGATAYGGGSPHAGAVGGNATATSSGLSSSGGAVNVTASASGGGGGGSGGAAVADATAIGVTLAGNIQANASANGGNALHPGTASAWSEAKNPSGETLTKASAPQGGEWESPSALTAAAVGSGNIAPVSITSGQAVSRAIQTPGGPDFAEGAMSAGYGGGLEPAGSQPSPLQYNASAVFEFTTSTSETLDLDLLSDNFSGVGFDSLKLEVIVDGTGHTYTLSTLVGAESFFASNALDLGPLVAGSQSVKLEYFLDYNSGTLATAGAGFGFAYDLATAPLAAAPAATTFDFTAAPLTSSVPEPSTWAMMLVGFAGLAFAGYRGSRQGAALGA